MIKEGRIDALLRFKTAGHRGHEIPVHADKIMPTWNFHFCNGEAVFFVGESDPLDLSLKLCGHAVLFEKIFRFACTQRVSPGETKIGPEKIT
jgi:hypothetical protein